MRRASHPGSGEGDPANVRVYLGRNFTSGSGPADFNPAEPTTFQDLSVFGSTPLADGVFVG